jgi:hypothetical protein
MKSKKNRKEGYGVGRVYSDCGCWRYPEEMLRGTVDDCG